MKYAAFPEYEPSGVAGKWLEAQDGFLSGLGDLE